GCRVGLDEVGPLVADHRGAGRARGEDLVGERPVDAVALGEDETLRDGAVEPEDERVDRKLHDRAGPERSEMEDPARKALEDRTGAAQDARLATDHDRQLSRPRRGDAARDGAVEDPGATCPDG